MSQQFTQQPPIVDGRLIKHLARRFNALFNFEQPVDAADGQGGMTRSWSTLAASVPGALQPLSAEERLARGGVAAVNMFSAFVAYRTDVTPLMRLRYGSRIFDIADVSDMGEQHIITEITCRERFPA